MNDLDEIENQLRSWAPRKPSLKLQKKLGLASGEIAGLRWLFSDWLVPAMAAVIVACSIFSSGHLLQPFLRPAPAQTFLASAVFSNQSVSFFTPREHPLRRNVLPRRTFEWTNATRSPSTLHSPILWMTNSLVH